MFRPLSLSWQGSFVYRMNKVGKNYFSLTCWGMELSRIFDPTNNTDDGNSI